MALFYLDSSALVKLVRSEPETAALDLFLGPADILSADLAAAEVPRAIRRAAALDPALDLARLLTQSEQLLDSVALLPVDQALFAGAGAITVPYLRTLDAVHLVVALDCAPIDAFVSYDERQSAGARLAGLRTIAPA